MLNASASLELQALPSSPELEQELLGALLSDNRVWPQVSALVDFSDFHQAAHGRIFEAIGILCERGEPASPVTLKRLFDADGELSDVGGAAYLARLASACTSTIGALDYARSVRSLSIRRRLIEECRDTIEDAMRDDLARADETLLEEAESRIAAIAPQEGHRQARALPSVVDGHIAAVEAAYRAGGRISGLATGICALDRILGGLGAGNLYLLAARPSMGKSLVAGVIARHAAKSSTVAIFSLEMSSEQWVDRWIAQDTGVSSGRQRRGDLADWEWASVRDSADLVRSLPIHIDDTGGLTIAQIRSRARRLARRRPLGLIVVDHIQLMRASKDAERFGRVSTLTEISGGLKALAKEIGVPVLALSQLSRAVEGRDDKRPGLSDLRESGSLEQDSDVVMFLYREAYYLEKTRAEIRKLGESEATWQARCADYDAVKHKAEINIAKHRGDKTGTIDIYFDGETSRVTDLGL